jgi:hypothetical protein
MDSTFSNLIRFNQSGGIIWSVPNDYPQIATADGGVIGYSGITYDSQGRATGQVGSVPLQSWHGNAYQYGSVDQVVPTPTNVATTLWAQVGANPSGNSTAARPWYFVLVWQNDFSFTPDYPNPLPALTTDITGFAATIKAAALANLKRAYYGFPVTVVEGTSGTGDDRATVLDHQTVSPDRSICGITDSQQFPRETASQVDYIRNMRQAQDALKVTITDSQSEAAALRRTDLIQAIGRGIGTYAAHEIAHHFLLKCCDMDTDPGGSDDPAARATYNNPLCVGGADQSPWTGYWQNPLIYQHWEGPSLQGLNQCLNRGWRDFGGSSCHN